MESFCLYIWQDDKVGTNKKKSTEKIVSEIPEKYLTL